MFLLRIPALLASLLWVLIAPIPAQEAPRTDIPDEKTLEPLVISIQDLESSVKTKREQLNKAVTPEERKVLFDDLTATITKLDDLKSDLLSISAGLPQDEADEVKVGRLSIQQEINDLLMPVLSGLKEATQQPRAIEALNLNIEAQQARRLRIEAAVNTLKTNIPGYESKLVSSRLSTMLKDLEKQLQEVENRISVLRLQRDDLSRNQKSLLESSADIFRKYFRTRGWNFLLVATVFIVVFFGSRLLHQHAHRLTSWHKPSQRTFATRLAMVTYYLLTFVGAIFLSLLLLYVRDDWMLLSVAILFLLALALAAKNSLPHFYEQTRMLLNLGEAREGERIVISGIPWRVDSLSFMSTLTNPWLSGGKLRIPLRQMAALTSRPYDPHEPWFPSKEGDWVILDDGTSGRVVLQSPEFVQLVMLGSSRKTYPVHNYLHHNPRNLSLGFRIVTNLSISYQHQDGATTDIPEMLRDDLDKKLREEVTREQLEDVTVEFSKASPSSLDLHISADFTGDVAVKHDRLKRLLQKHAVEACASHDWKIPMQQMVVHVAK